MDDPATDLINVCYVLPKWFDLVRKIKVFMYPILSSARRHGYKTVYVFLKVHQTIALNFQKKFQIMMIVNWVIMTSYCIKCVVLPES